MIVSTDQQEFSVTIMVKGSDSAASNERGASVSSEVMDCSDHSTNMMAGLRRIKQAGLLMDICLWAEGVSFQAHRVVLASISPYFQAMFTSGYKEARECQQGRIPEILLPGVTSEALRHVLDFIYSGKLELSPLNIQAVLSCASHLQVQSVVSQCSRYLHSNLDLDNCRDILSLADTFSLAKLKHNVLRYICENLAQFCQTEEFLCLDVTQLLSLLNSNLPINMTESDLLAATADWIEHDLSCRLSWADKLVDGVRLADIPSKDIALVLDRPGLACMGTKLAALERLSPLRQSDTYKMVNSRGMEMAVVKLGGFGSSGITNSVTYFHINHKNGAWRQLTSIPHIETCNFGAAVVHNQLYVVGGCFNQGLQENIHPFGFCYNPRQDKWASINTMTRERCRFTLTECGGKLYAIGGSSETIEMEDEMSTEMFCPESDTWRTCAPLPTGNRSQHAAVKLHNKILVSGGLDHDTSIDSLLEYCPESDTWRQVTRLPRSRADHAMIVHDNTLYIVGGWSDTGAGQERRLVSEVDRYDISSDMWTVETSLLTPRHHASVTKVAGKLFIIGGFLDTEAMLDRASRLNECYDLNTGQWSVSEQYPEDVWEHCCVSLNVPVCRDDPLVTSPEQEQDDVDVSIVSNVMIN